MAPNRPMKSCIPDPIKYNSIYTCNPEWRIFGYNRVLRVLGTHVHMCVGWEGGGKKADFFSIF